MRIATIAVAIGTTSGFAYFIVFTPFLFWSFACLASYVAERSSGEWARLAPFPERPGFACYISFLSSPEKSQDRRSAPAAGYSSASYALVVTWPSSRSGTEPDFGMPWIVATARPITVTSGFAYFIVLTSFLPSNRWYALLARLSWGERLGRPFRTAERVASVCHYGRTSLE